MKPGAPAGLTHLARSRAWVLVVLTAAASCSELPEVGSNVCGNGVIESGEDCDLYAPPGQACGPAASSGQCRFTCGSASPGASCPQGWACGLDKVCRQPTGEFSLLAPTTPSDARRIVTGDFDGDGKKDVVAIGSSSELGLGVPRMLLSAGDGSFQATQTPELPIGSPSVQDLSEDRLDDIVFSTPFGLGVLLGNEDHRLVPVAYPLSTFDRDEQGLLLAIHGYKPGPREIGPLVLAGAQGILFLASTDAAVPMTFLSGSIDAFREGFVAAQIVRGAKSPCEEVLLAASGTSSVQMIEPCNAEGQWAAKALPSVVLELPAGASIGTGVRVTDLNQDGKQDLIVADLDNGAWVGFGCDPGGLCSLPDTEPGSLPGTASRFKLAKDDSCDTADPVDIRLPLAIGDLQGDGLPDVVTHSEIRVTRGLEMSQQGSVVLRGCNSGRRIAGEWSVARIADLNGDALPDVIAGSAVAPDLQLFVGTGTDWLNPATVETGFATGHMLLGDFDGDLIRDIAIGELRVDVTPGERLAIAFGRAQGIPLPAVEVARFPAIMQLEAAPWDPWDAIDEIGVIEQTEDPQIQAIAVLIGQSSRQPFAPFGLLWGDEDEGALSRLHGFSIASVAASLTDDEHPDVASLGIDESCASLKDCQARLWLLESTGKAQMHVHRPSETLDPDIGYSRVIPGATEPSVLAFLLAGDADGDGTEEILLLSPRVSGGTGLWMARPERTTGEWQRPEATLELVGSSPLSIDFDAAPVLADLDLDGKADLIVLLPDEQGRRTLRIAWNDGVGGFGLEDAETVESGGEEPAAFAVIQANADAWPELAVGTSSTLRIAAPKTDAPRSWSSSPVALLPSVRALAGADVTGDGLDDIVVATENGIRVWEGKPALR